MENIIKYRQGTLDPNLIINDDKKWITLLLAARAGDESAAIPAHAPGTSVGRILNSLDSTIIFGTLMVEHS